MKRQDQNTTMETEAPVKKSRKLFAKEFRQKLKTNEGSESLKEFVDLYNAGEDYALEFFESGGTLSDILETIEVLTRTNQKSQLALPFQAFTILLLEAITKKLNVPCDEPCRELLTKHYPTIKNMLSLSSTSKQRKVALKLLSTMVTSSGAIAHEVLSYVSFDAPVLEVLTNPGVRDDHSVRTSFIHFVLSFLIDGDATVIAKFLEKRGVLTSVFAGLLHDRAETVRLVLTTVQDKVVEDKRLSKTLKMQTFNTHVIKSLVNLYNWKGPIVNKTGNYKKRLSQVTVVDPIGKDDVSDCVHRLLLRLCSSKLGVIFRDVTLGLGEKTCNSLMLTVLKGLEKPWDHPKAGELVENICWFSPDLVRHVFNEVLPFLEPRVSVKWINAIRFVGNIIRGMDSTRIGPYFENATIRQIVQSIKTLCAPHDILKVVNECLSYEHMGVRYEAVRLVLTMVETIRGHFCYIQSSRRFTQTSAFTIGLVEYLEENLPKVEVMMKGWGALMYPELGVPSYDEYRCLLLGVMYGYATVCPNAMDEIVNKTDPMEFYDMITNEVALVKIVDLLLRYNPNCLLPNDKLFGLVFPMLLKSGERSVLTRLVRNTTIFDGCEHEIEIWSGAESDETATMLTAAFNNTYINYLEYWKRLADVKERTSSSSNRADFERVIKNLQNDVYETNKDGVQTSLGPFVIGVLETDSRNGYVNVALTHLLHAQTSPEVLTEVVSSYSVDKAVTKYFRAWGDCAHPMSARKIHEAPNAFTELGQYLLGHQTDFTLDGNTTLLTRMVVFYLSQLIEHNAFTEPLSERYYDVIVKLLARRRECVELVLTHPTLIRSFSPGDDSLSTRFIMKIIKYVIGMDTNEGDMGGTKQNLTDPNGNVMESKGNVIDSKGDIDNPNAVTNPKGDVTNPEVDVTNPGDPKSVIDPKECVTDPKSIVTDLKDTVMDSKGVVTVSKRVVIDSKGIVMGSDGIVTGSKSIVMESLLRPFRKIVLNRLDGLLRRCKKQKDSSEGYDMVDYVAVLGLGSEEARVFGVVAELPTECFVSAENKPSVVVDLGLYVMERKRLDLEPLEAFGMFVGKLGSLYTHRVELNLERVEGGLYDYVEAFPHAVDAFETEWFQGLLVRARTRSSARLSALLLRHNPGFYKAVESVLNDIIDRRELVFTITDALIDNPPDGFVQTVYTRYESTILKLLEKPQKSPQYLVEYYKTVIVLITNCMRVETCKELVSKLNRFEVAEPYHVAILTEVYRKCTDPPVLNYTVTIMNVLINALKRNQPDWVKIDEIAKMFVGYVQTFERVDNLGGNGTFRQFAKLCLKHGLVSGSRLIGALTVLCGFCNDDEAYLPEVFEMAISHSESLDILLDDHKMKTDLTGLLLTLCRKNRNVVNKSHVAVWLGAYGGTLSEADRNLLELMYLYEDAEVGFHRYSPYLWGRAAVEYYSVRCGIETTLWRQPKPAQVLDIFNIDRIQHTVMNFPRNRSLRPERLPNEEPYSVADVYDPAFYLPLLSQLLAAESTIRWYQCKFGVVALVIVALTSEVEDVRKAACHVLARFHYHLEAVRSGKDRLLWLHFVEALCRSVSRVESLRLSSIIGLFMSRCAIVFNRPDHPLYTALTNYIMAKDHPDIQCVPELLELLNSHDPKHKQHRNFILQVMRDGTKSDHDLKIMFRTMAFKFLMDLFGNVSVNTESKLLILGALSSSVSVPMGARSLVQNYGLLSWLYAVIKRLDRHSSLVPTIVDLLSNLIGSLDPKQLRQVQHHVLSCLTELIPKLDSTRVDSSILVRFAKALSAVFTKRDETFTKEDLIGLLEVGRKCMDCRRCFYYLECRNEFVIKKGSDDALESLTLKWIELNRV